MRYAFTRALERWGHDGVPSSPAAWLKTTARNRALDRALDRLRRTKIEMVKLQAVAMSAPGEATTGDGGSGSPTTRLWLIFTCCHHRALPVDAQVALTARQGGKDETTGLGQRTTFTWRSRTRTWWRRTNSSP